MRWSSTEGGARVWIALAAVATSVIATSPASAQVCHSGNVEDSAIVWRTTALDSTRFVAPLPDDTQVESIEGGTLVREDGRVVGLERLAGSRAVVLVTRQRLDGENVTLRPPLAPELQRVVLAGSGGESVSFAPALDGALERHVGYHASHDLSWQTRRAVDGSCGASDAHAIPIYVMPTSGDELRGTLVRASA